MHYYDVAVTARIGGSNLYTYSSDKKLPLGEVVSVGFRNRAVIAVVVSKSSKPIPTIKIKVLETLDPRITLPRHSMRLAKWISDYYGTSMPTVLPAFLPKYALGAKTKKDVVAKQTKKVPIDIEVSLNRKQKNVIGKITKRKDIHILHGVTGSGKTHVYLDLAQKAADAGEQVMILVPEIALTAQIVDTFEKHFGGMVNVQHSSMTPAKRYAHWLKSYRDEGGSIWIGTRSNLFLPLTKLGLIIVDEFHDQSFKQESQPRYNANTVAAKLRQLTNSTMVLGSATPSVRDMYVSKIKKLPIHVLPNMISKRTTDLHLVDLRVKREQKDKVWFSQQLKSALQSSLERSEQALLFLNRRGNATKLQCQMCGWHKVCESCSTNMVYHQDENKLRCHTCGRQGLVPISCQECGSTELILRGLGTKEVEIEVKKLFPEANVMRIDQDSAKPSKVSGIYKQMRDDDVDIIIGTQMVAKGFDLPRLSTIGIMDADTMLNFPDFSTGERTYQLLTQVMGRGGRRGQKRTVVLQTFQPEHPIIQAALNEDYEEFLQYELNQRQSAGFPPFKHLVKLNCDMRDGNKALAALKVIAEQPENKDLLFLGPAPAFYEYRAGKSRWQLCALSSSRSRLVELARSLPSQIQSDFDPLSLL